MSETGVLRQEQFNAAIGPVRRALCVPVDDLPQLCTAIRAATSLWGGMRFPILPVDPDGSVAAGYLQVAEALGVDNALIFGAPQPDPLALSDGRVLPAARARPFTDVAFWQPPPIVSYSSAELMTTSVTSADRDDPLLITAVGRLADPELESQEWRTFGAQLSTLAPDSAPLDILHAQTQGHSALAGTVHRTGTYFASAPFAASIALLHVVSDEGPSFEELVTFWNLRALRPGEEGVSVILLDSQIQDAAVMHRLSEIVSATVRTTPAVVLNSLSVSSQRLSAIRKKLGFTTHQGRKWSETLGPSRDRELTGAVNVDLRQFWQGKRRSGSVAPIHTPLFDPVTALHFPSPIPFHPQFTGSHPVRLALSSAAFRGPQKPRTAAHYLPNSSWRDGELVVVTGMHPRFDLSVHHPTSGEILAASTEFPYALSDKGRELSAVLDRVGDATLFLNRHVHSAVRHLTPKDSRSLRSVFADWQQADAEQVKAALASVGEQMRTFNELAGLMMAEIGGARRNVANAIERLVAAGMVERGLCVTCKTCSVREFRRFTDSEAVPLCQGCHSEARYAGQDQPHIVYRLNTLMRRVSANGGLVVLAAMEHLDAEGAFCLPGVDLDSPDGVELDLLGWRGRALFAGEAKMTSSGFDDLPRDLAASKAAGAEEHVMVCMEPIEPSLVIAAKREAKRLSMTLRVLDSEILFG